MASSAIFPTAAPTLTGHDDKAGLRLAFARAVAKPGGKATLIDENNDKDGPWIDIKEAVRSARSFMVDVDPNVLAIDCDRADLVPEVLRLAEKLRLDGYESVLVNSGQADRLHLFARIPDADLLARYTARAREVRLDVRRTIRPPLAPHRLGLPVSLYLPDDPAAALAALTPRSTTRALSPRMDVLLRDGDRDGKYEESGRRSAVVMAIVLGMVNAGWTRDAAFQALRDPQNRGGEKIQQRSERLARRYVAACWKKAQARVASHPAIRDRHAALKEIERVRAAVEAHMWKGTTGSTDRRVIEAHLITAERTGKIVYGASVRTIAELAGIPGLDRVVKAHRRLRDQGWLKLRARWGPGRATRWSLRPPTKGVKKPNSQTSICLGEAVTNSNSQTSLTGGDERDCTVFNISRTVAPGADLWRRGGLGGNAWRIWDELKSETLQSPKDLADRLGLHRRTVRYHLERLGKHGLAVRDAQGRWRKGDASPDDVAVKLGVAGAGERQRLDHQRDRERYHENVAHRRTTVRV